MKADGVPPTRGSFSRCNMMNKVIDAAGGPNEYNTATFKPYSAIIDTVRTALSFVLMKLYTIEESLSAAFVHIISCI